jgi:hypothetical protein
MVKVVMVMLRMTEVKNETRVSSWLDSSEGESACRRKTWLQKRVRHGVKFGVGVRERTVPVDGKAGDRDSEDVKGDA